MGENEELEAGLAGLFESGSVEQTGAVPPGLGTEDQDGPVSDETETLSLATEASDPVANMAEVAETDVDGDLSLFEAQDVSLTAGPEGSPTASTGGSTVHLIVFALNDEQYGIGIAAVDSIIRPTTITAVPRAPDFVQGVTNLRGTVLPVVDLKKRLGLQAADMTRDTRIIVAESDGNKVGMLVDAVIEVRRVPDADIEPPSPLVSTVDASLLMGIAKVEDERLIILLDLDQVLAQQ